MYCEYDGQTYYPKYAEDLVHTEVMLPVNAPEDYKKPEVLWNAVENAEKNSNAQLARTFRVELPNEWSYELATEVMRDYIRRNFVDEGMCVQFAVHDSENREGQRNLHCHMLLTIRGIDENGKWMPKQKKVYLTDENGERIPLIDKKTGQQKVDRQNRKQWKCRTIPTNDWGSKDNAKKWRADLTGTINSVNEEMGMTEKFWEHRSFKDQGLDILPQIHLGAKASAMERAGIPTIRGNINRSIIENNAVILKAKGMLADAEKYLKNVRQTASENVRTAADNVKNEIIELIRNVAKRNKDRLSLPVISGKYLRLISNRADMQSRTKMEEFVHNMNLTTFDEMKSFKEEHEKKYESVNSERTALIERQNYLSSLLQVYEKYEPYIKYNKEKWALSGLKRKLYERKHIPELARYDFYREQLKNMIQEDSKKISANSWKKELASVQKQIEQTKKPYTETVIRLASVEVLEHNRSELERLLHNERSAREKEQRKKMKMNTQEL